MLRCSLLALAVAGTSAFSSTAFNGAAGLHLRSRTSGLHSQSTSARVQSRLRTSALRMADSESGQVDVTEEPKVIARGPATLTDATEWRMAMSFTGPNPSAPPVEVTCKIQFIEEEGYEPPQGPIMIDPNSKYLAQQQALWRLGEDPEAQLFDKAGFWIWGLLDEPAYPFFFTQFVLTQDIPLADGVIPAGIIYGQADIKRDKEKGVILENGVLSYRERVKIQADLIGLSDGILAEIRPVGTFVCRPA